jgi:hypothetical protein
VPQPEQSVAFQTCGVIKRQLRSPFPRGYGELPLLKAFNVAILASQRRNPANVV